MTSGIADYARQPGFAAAINANPSTRFSEARLVSYAVGVPLGPAGWSYSDTNYILAQMIIERVTHRSYGSGIIIAVATSSATNPDTNDWLQITAIRVYRTLQKAGAVHPG